MAITPSMLLDNMFRGRDTSINHTSNGFSPELCLRSPFSLLDARSTTDAQEVLCVAPLDTIKTNNFDAAPPLPSVSGASSDVQSTCYPLDAPSGSNVPNTDLAVQYHDVVVAPQYIFNGALDGHSFEAPQGSLWSAPPPHSPVASTDTPEWNSIQTRTDTLPLRPIQGPAQLLHDPETNKDDRKSTTRKRGQSQRRGQEVPRRGYRGPSARERIRTTMGVPPGTISNDSPRATFICPLTTADCAASAHPTEDYMDTLSCHLNSFHRDSYDGTCPLCARPVQLGSLKKHLQSGQHWGTGRRSCTYPGCSASYSRSDRLYKHKAKMGH